MKCVKVLGLTAVAAMALTALIGAGSASATVLCTTTTNPCGTGWHVDTFVASVATGQSVTIKNTSGSIEAACTVASSTTEKTATGSATTTPAGSVSKANLTWGAVGSGCTNTTDTIAGGALEDHWIETDNGTVTARGLEVTVVLAGVSCTFGVGNGISLGDITGGHPAVWHWKVVMSKTAGSFLCPSTSVWEGTFTITNHTKLYVVPE